MRNKSTLKTAMRGVDYIFLDAAQNIAFMYSHYESCKMNGIDFGEYVEDILTPMMNGDDDHRSMIPCYYTTVSKHSIAF